MTLFNAASYQALTEDAAVGAVGVAVSIYGLNDVTDANTINLYDGTDATGTLIIKLNSRAAGDWQSFGEGILFPHGCFVEGVTTALTVIYTVV